MECLEKSLVRSCTTCAKAKAKCVRNPGADVCERCARLKKDCQMKEPVLRRRKPMKTTRTAQLEKLENKIEHLVNALSTQQAYRSSVSLDYGQQPSPESQYSASRTDNLEKGDANRIAAARGNDVVSSLCHGCDQATEPLDKVPSPTAHESLALEEASVLLDRWRRLMSTGMPFVILPDVSGHDAATLMQEKPVLLRAICTVTMFHDLSRQKEMVKDLNREIAERMFVKNEKSIDLLQGLLVLVEWYHPHVFWSPQTTNLLHLASALVIDLGIDRPPSQCVDFKGTTAKAVHGSNLLPKVHTLEDRRALIGVFYLTNMLSSSFRKLDTMPFTNYMDQCLTSLQEAREHDSDLFLVKMVQIQRVIEHIHMIDVSSTPARVYMRAVQVDIDRVRRADSSGPQDNVFLRMQYLAAEIYMWELSLNELQENQSRQKSLTTHLEDLYHCVAAIKLFLEAFFSISTSDYQLLPFTVLVHFAHIFICLTKIASLEIEGWDINALNDQINFLQAVEECAKRFDQSMHGTPDGLTLNNETFGKWATKLRWMKSVYEAKFAQDIEASSVTPGQLQQPTPPDDPVLSADFFNYLDENFWEGFGEMETMLFPGAEVT